MTDVAIIGGGPAGLNAALVLGRARRHVVLCDEGSPRNIGADEMHGFITRDYTPPREMLALGRAQLSRYPTVEIIDERVDEATATAAGFRVRTAAREFAARKLVLATGMVDELPRIDGLGDFWGTTIFTCPVCDGWEMRDRVIGIAGERANLVGYAQELFQWSRRLTVYGYVAAAYGYEEHRWVASSGISTHGSGVAAFRGIAGRVEYVQLNDGTSAACEAFFLCVPLIQRSDLAKRLGCALTPHGRIAVDDKQRTSVGGVYAAGDACTKIHQVIAAAASGAAAAIFANDDLTTEDAQELAQGRVRLLGRTN